MVFGAKSKKQNRTPPVLQSPTAHGAVSLTPPADLNSSIAGTVGTREVQQGEGDSGGGVGRGLHCTAVNSSSFPFGAPPAFLISTTSGHKPANVCKIRPPQRSCCYLGITDALLTLSSYLSMSFVTKLTCRN